MNFKLPARKKIALLPTPIEKPIHLGNQFPPHQIFIKRDDLTGCTLTGNKIRKLEFLAADYEKQGADVLITCGGVQSNHARATAVLAAETGLQSHLVLRGSPDEGRGGNFFLKQLVGAKVTFITADEYRDQRNEIMAQIARDYAQNDQKAYIIPEGASNALGAMGYLHAVSEMLLQWKEMNIHFDLIIVPVGSGGTYAGLLLGKHLYKLDIEVIGFNVADTSDYFVNRIFEITQDVKKDYGLDAGIKKTDIHIIDGYVGVGYAKSRPEEILLIQQIARENGLILDPVYTGKAMYGLLDQLNQGNLKAYQNILFIHTGGIWGIFPAENLFSK
ncbi:D-cysteine desulfhydrase family protein [candidate division KSB1 bacterium]|nr:D-cysteine desulfhydrase family protein [candidate division KSB1 bacterium]